jgi:hypothetical protein
MLDLMGDVRIGRAGIHVDLRQIIIVIKQIYAGFA